MLFLKLSQCIFENNEMVKSLVTLFVFPKGLAANVLSVFGASVKSVFAPVLLGTVGADIDSTANIPLLNEKAKGLLFELERSISASPARGVVQCNLGKQRRFQRIFIYIYIYIYTPLDELHAQYFQRTVHFSCCTKLSRKALKVFEGHVSENAIFCVDSW